MKDFINGLKILGFRRSIELIILAEISYFQCLFNVWKTIGIKNYVENKKRFEDEFVKAWIEVYTTPYLCRMSSKNKLRYVKATI